MILNTTMIQTIVKIVKEEPQYEQNLIEDDFLAAEAGNELIQIYSNTENLKIRQLITNFMEEAGHTWMRKLLTRDTSPVYS